MRQGPNSVGLSRKAILAEVDHSLRRLGTDYIDLYQIHRCDRRTPIEETLEALDDVVRAGKVRYIGASSMWAWEFAQDAAHRRRARLDALRQHAEPLQPALPRGGARDDPAVPRRGHRRDPVEPARARPPRPRRGTRRPSAPSTTSSAAQLCTPRGRPRDRRARSPRSRPSAACRWPRWRLAWLLSKPGITAPIIGATKPHHIDDAVAAVELTLSDEEIAPARGAVRPASRRRVLSRLSPTTRSAGGRRGARSPATSRCSRPAPGRRRASR